MTFIIYSRKSVVTERGDSIENQAEMCRQYIQATYPGHSDIAVYEDEGFSGKNLERPQFRQMMRDIRKSRRTVWSATGWTASAAASVTLPP